MLYTCEQCGRFGADMTVDEKNGLLVCPECGHTRPFRRAPLFGIGGASGSGKTAICRELAGRLPGVVCLDGDIFWDEKRFSQENAAEFYEYVLRIAMNISQSGMTVAIFNAGFAIPQNLETCTARRYFSDIHYLALYCSDERDIEARLGRRPSASEGFINAMKGFNAFFRFGAPNGEDGPEVERIDTSGRAPEETAARVRECIMSKL